MPFGSPNSTKDCFARVRPVYKIGLCNILKYCLTIGIMTIGNSDPCDLWIEVQ